MAKSKKKIDPLTAGTVTEAVPEMGNSDYIAKAEKHGCPVLDIITLIAEGLQAWRHGKSVPTAPHK
jgi:hypothetical protein